MKITIEISDDRIEEMEKVLRAVPAHFAKATDGVPLLARLVREAFERATGKDLRSHAHN